MNTPQTTGHVVFAEAVLTLVTTAVPKWQSTPGGISWVTMLPFDGLAIPLPATGLDRAMALRRR